MTLLNGITSPQDIKSLSINELEALACELRKRIIEVVSKNGGHLSSNLGVVELTLALHKVFDSPLDKLIWDVGHQAYSHKILTGRNDLFNGLWKYNGSCGFTHPKESEHDHFHAGHAGTALSLALGAAMARDIDKGQNYVIPIIGDATLTCGMSLEALNNIPRDLKRFIIILNDNEMSISKNVGAITHILSRLLSNPTTNKLYQEIDTIVSKIPGLGEMLSNQGHKITGSLKNLVSPAAFFEQYGVAYIGPIDGHEIKKLVDVLEGVKDSTWPVLIHVITQKGKGMENAVEDPISYHGAKPFSLTTGQFHPSTNPKPTFPKIFGKHVVKMGEKDPNLVIVTPAMSAGSCLDEFIQKFPNRGFDVGIAESHSVTFCGGLASDPMKKVICCIYATFLQRAFDNLFHDVCLQELPVLFCLDRAGLAPSYGSTHHGIYDISFLNAMPNMIIAQPRNGHILKEMLESAFSWNRPTALRYPNLSTDEPDLPIHYREIGKGEVIVQGEQLLILGLGTMIDTALEVRKQLQMIGIKATVADPVFLKPLDTELLTHLLNTHPYVVTIEEHSITTGLGSILNNFFMVNGFHNVQVLNFGIPERFIGHGDYKDLLQEIGLTPKAITEKIVHHFSFSEAMSPS